MAMMMRTVDEQDHHHDHDHENQHREFSSQRGVVGPTNANHVIYDVALSAPTLHHPFHHNTATHSYNINTAFKTPGGQDQMASSQEISMGFPFTSAQWKELERQAMIYKYMMASLPVPIDLLLPNHISTTSTNLASSPPNLRYINGKADMEPGRCKRTDGKKWRCSRDVAPNQKYCERHMNRGRPRSRKHVEQQHLQDNNNNNNNNNKRAHQSQDHQAYNTSTNSKTKTSKCNSITSLTSNENSTTIVSQTPFLGANSSTSMSNYHNYPCVNTASPFESRNLELMMKTEQQNVVQMAASDPRWLHLVQTKMELSQNPNDDEEEEEEEGPFLNLNSYASFNGTGHGNQDRDCALFLYHGDDVVSEPPSRSFIDAWSQTTPKMAADHETRRTLINDNNNKTCSASSCQGNLSPSSLTLSMGHRVSSISGETAFEETLRVCNPICWVSPLAEVLRPSAASEPPSPFAGSSTVTATVMSSPSGVLQKTAMASLSDSSNCSSPGLASASMAKPEISLL